MCQGWDTDDLLTHLLTRERRPDAALARAIPRLRGWSTDVARTYHRLPWAQQVQLLRSGPPRLNPLSIDAVDSLVNTSEYFIHHEDVRRGEPGWAPRVLDAETQAVLAKQLLSGPFKLALRRYPVGFRVRFPDGAEHQLKSGEPVVTLIGEPGEVLLWLSGRQRACRVEVTGSPAALAALDTATP